MTQIKKILDQQGNEVYIRTSTKAVVDENGYTAESRLQAMQDEINQAQLAVGAVPSDLTPTNGSSNWVTSGGVFNSLYTHESIDISTLDLKAFYVNSNNVWASSNTTCGKFLPVNAGDIYMLTPLSASDSVIISIVKSMSQTAGSAPDFSASFPARIVSGQPYTVTIPSDANYIWIRTKNAGNDITPVVVKIKEKFASTTDVENLIQETNGLKYPYLSLVDFLGETSVLAFWIGGSGNWNAKSDNYPYNCRILAVDKNRKYKITANSTMRAQYALLTNNTPVVGQQATSWNNSIPKVIEIGEDEVINTGNYGYLYLRWDGTYYNYPEKIEEYVSVQEALDADAAEESIKELEIEYGFIYTSGYNSATISDNQNYKYWRSCGFIKVNTKYYYTIKTNVNASYIRFYWYDDNREFIDITTITELSIDGNGLYYVSSSAIGSYLRVVISYETEYTPKAFIYGILEDEWKCKLSGIVRSGNAINFLVSTYYQTLNSDIEETTTIQDVGYKLINRGLLQLPTNYDPDGEPSRLVIYCHGADGFQNWDNNTTSFDVDHIDPTLWVNSGYAVMDMDDLTRTEYIQNQDIPTLLTQNCYLRGYEHVVKNYNIRKDGVILCGRSLGGQRVMMLLGSQLPILCCCLIAPSCGFSRYWNMQDRRRITTVYNNFPTTIEVNEVETDINWGNTSEISDIEWAAMQKYYRLVLNTHGILKLLCVSKSDFFATHTIDGVEVSLRSNPETWDRIVFTNWVGKTKIPIKIWYAEDDTTLPDPTRNQDLLYNIVNNGGGLCEYHIFATGGHYPERDGAKVTYTNKYGVTYENTSLVYAEMLQFIRRYEQDN